MSSNGLTTLFGFPVWKTKVNPELYNKQEIIDIIDNNYRKSPYRDDSWSGDPTLHHAYEDWNNAEFDVPDFNQLRSVYNNVAERFMAENNINGTYFAEIVNYTVINNEQSMRPHMHLGVTGDITFAAVHYMSFDPAAHSPLVFRNNNILSSIMQTSEFSKMIDLDDTPFGYMTQSYKFQIEEDDMIIFPSCLVHGIGPSLSSSLKNRICIASNIHMRVRAE